MVPYNKFLLSLFKAHANLEVLVSISVFNYIYKYITKGSDNANFKIVDSTKDNDEITKWQQAKYTCSSEAMYKLLGSPLYYQKPAPHRLELHLPYEQMVTFDPAVDNYESLQSRSKTMLTAYFELNSRDEFAVGLHYLDIIKFYVFNKKSKKWVRRKRGVIDVNNSNMVRGTTIGYLDPVIPTGRNGIEKFALNILLLHIKGATSFKNLKTVNGIEYPSFKDAAIALNLMEHDEEIEFVFNESAQTLIGKNLRKMFALLVGLWVLKDPKEFWEKHKDKLIED